jgi:hypothetical protein
MAHAQTSLITNGNFESGTTGWTISNTTQINVGTDNYYVSPYNSLMVYSSAVVGAYAYQNFTATIGSSLSVYTGASTQDTTTGSVLLQLNYNDSSYTDIDLTANHNWTNYNNYTLTPTAGKYAISIEIYVAKTSSARTSIDDLFVISSGGGSGGGGLGGYTSGTLISALYNESNLNGWTPTLSDWNTSMDAAASDIDMMMESVQFGNTTTAAVQKIVDDSNSPPAILYFYSTYAIKMGLTYNATALKFALNNELPLDYGFTTAGAYSTGLPASEGYTNYTGGSPTQNAFYMYEGYLLYVYYWANYYSYDLSNWNITTAYSVFTNCIEQSYQNGYYGDMLYVSSSDSAYFLGLGLAQVFSGPASRYYDEFGETIRNLLLFYQFGETSALNLAVSMWNNYTVADWNATEGYFQYEPGVNQAECEAPYFLEDCLLLQTAYFDATGLQLPNATLIQTDLQTRFLTLGWSSIQWSDNIVIHAYPGNYQLRMWNTLGAWEAMYADYPTFTAKDQQTMQNMLLGNGSANYLEPAWWYLYNSTLYDSTNGLFYGLSGAGSTDSQSTGQAELLTALQGIVPITATLAVPIQEDYYQGSMNMINPQLFNVNFTGNTLTVGISSPGIVTFIYGSTPFNYTFTAPGLYTLSFASNWNSISSKTVNTLPSEEYAFGLTYSDLAVNNTMAGHSTTISSLWNAEAASLSGYIFSTNNTGSWVNSTFTALSTNPQWINQTLTLTSTVGATVGYELFVNDSAGDQLNTGIVTLQTSGFYITASSDAYVNLSPSGLVGVDTGGSQAFTFSPVNGSYTIQNVIINGTTQVSTSSPYTFLNVQGNESIEVSTSNIIYSVNATSDSGCVITPSGNLIYSYGTNASFTMLAYPNYEIYNLQVNSTALGPLTSYSFTPTGNGTILYLTSISTVTGQPAGGNGYTPQQTPTPTNTTTPTTASTPSMNNLIFVIGTCSIVFVCFVVVYAQSATKKKGKDWSGGWKNY